MSDKQNKPETQTRTTIIKNADQVLASKLPPEPKPDPVIKLTDN